MSIERDGNNISTPKSNIRSVSAITVVTDGRTEVFTKLSVEFASQKKKKCIVPTLYLLYNVCFVNTYVYIYIYIYIPLLHGNKPLCCRQLRLKVVEGLARDV